MFAHNAIGKGSSVKQVKGCQTKKTLSCTRGHKTGMMDEEEMNGASDCGKERLDGSCMLRSRDPLPTESEEEGMDTIAEEEEQNAESAEQKVFIPGRGTALEEGEELVHDSSTYQMYHVVCLFDVP